MKIQDSKGTSYTLYNLGGKLLYRELASKAHNYIYLGNRLIAKDGIIEPSQNSRQDYRPFGATIAPAKDEVGYTGHKFDTDLGLSYMQARYYDPEIGRFYSNDPVGFEGHLARGNSPAHGFNRYVYANNNPYKYNDPDGEFVNFAIGAVVGAVAEVAVQVAFEGKSLGSLDGGAILQSAAIGAVSGGVGGAAGKLAGKVIASATKPANAFANGASKIATGAASGSVAGAVGGAVNNVTTQSVETGSVDLGKVGDAALIGAVTGGLGGSASGAVKANAAKATLGNSRANSAFTSVEPGVKGGLAASTAVSTATTTATKSHASCQESGSC